MPGVPALSSDGHSNESRMRSELARSAPSIPHASSRARIRHNLTQKPSRNDQLDLNGLINELTGELILALGLDRFPGFPALEDSFHRTGRLLVSNTIVGTILRLALLILTLCLASGCADKTRLSDLTHPTPQISYPDTDAGFRKFVSELVDAHANVSGVQGRMHALVIPNSSEWFIEVFGPTAGPTLDFQYRCQLSYQLSRLYVYLPLFARGQKRLLDTEYSEQNHLSPFVSSSELIPSADQPLRIYSASIATEEEGPWLKVNSFVYVDGSFRLLGALTLAPDWHSFYASYDKPFEP